MVTSKKMLEALRPLYNKHGIYKVDDIKSRHKGYWFSPGAMKFFNSRLMKEVFPSKDSIFFVSSEKGPDNIRAFSVRRYDFDSDAVTTVGEFQEYETAARARTAALRAAYNAIVGSEA